MARHEFERFVAETSDLDAIASAIALEQQSTRQRTFAQLAAVRPKRSLDESARLEADVASLTPLFDELASAAQALELARNAASLIAESQMAVAQAMALLDAAGLIDDSESLQTCPVCVAAPPSLTESRISTVRTWEPLRQAIAVSEARLSTAASTLYARLQTIWKLRADLVPKIPPPRVWEPAVAEADLSIQTAARATLQDLQEKHRALARFDQSVIALGTALKEAPLSSNTAALAAQSGEAIHEGLEALPILSASFRNAFADLESAVGIQATDDPEYTRREKWLGAYSDIDGIVSDIRWERAKSQAQASLKAARETLITIRQVLLESRRTAFSDGMNGIWTLLRHDHTATFHSLSIPAPRGRGFPVEIEVKAQLAGPAGNYEVDALRVFSESQVHVLGIAAFVTRSTLLGHQVLVLDDPVQSMDEDHFRTFAGPFLRKLVDDGFQVLILTHNQAFDREISFQHYDFDGYATLEMRHTRRLGCRAQEGNRRVAERLSLAEKKMEDGDAVGAWISIRRAIERLYTVVVAKYGPEGFDPIAWNRLSAENMWDQGAAQIIAARQPDAPRRLRSILGMTAGAAHDGEQAGETDVLSSIAFLRGLLAQLRVGG